MQIRERLYPKVYSVRLDQETLDRIEELRDWWQKGLQAIDGPDARKLTRSDIIRHAIEMIHADDMARKKTR